MELTVLFPMAGDGQRFGGTFKPFLDATEKKFIELAKEPFSVFTQDPAYHVRFVFIYRRDQEEEWNVQERLYRMFPNDSIECCILDRPTSGPLETVQRALDQHSITGAAFICDCDHAIPLGDMHQALSLHQPDLLIPTWKYREKEYASWGKVRMDLNRTPLAFYEKEHVPFSDTYLVEGMIGCYFIKDVSILQCGSFQNMSDIFPSVLRQGKEVQCLTLHQAEFFGTPEQLVSFRFDRARKYTFFIDIDGTLLHLPKHVPYEAEDTVVLPGTREKLAQWKREGHTIVLTTGRVTERREKLVQQLSDLAIPYDQLVTGLASGTRIVINDKKPYCAFHKMATAVQLRRNEGIGGVDVEPTPTLVKRLKGGSFADVYLIEKEGIPYVRKYIEKRSEWSVHVDTLRRQYEDLKRLTYLSKGLVPRVVTVHESNDEYYYDMEYMDGFVELSTCDEETIQLIVPRVVSTLHRDVYCFSKQVDGNVWLTEFLNEKILSKYSMIESLGESFHHAVNALYVSINGVNYKGLRHFFETEDLKAYHPSSLSPIHGDLTLENILYHRNKDTFVLIDPSGSRYVDAREMEVAKLFQYTVAKYQVWDSIPNLASYQDEVYTLNPLVVPNVYDEHAYITKAYDIEYKVGMFYLSTYFIRMIPFLKQASLEKAMCGLLFALSHLKVEHK